MPIGSGISGQLGLVAEVTYGTAVTVTRFYELRGETFELDIPRIESEGIRADQRVIRSDDWTTGVNRVKGGFEVDLTTKNMALLFSHSLGTIAAPSGSNPYTHVITPGSLTGKSLTVQVGRPSSDGTVQPFTFAGTKIADWTLGFELDKLASYAVGTVSKSVTTATALATASYTASNDLLAFTHGALTIGGSAVKVKKGSVKGTNPLNTDRAFMGDTTISEPLENGRRDYSFDLTTEFDGLTNYNRFVNGTEAALSLSFTRGSYSVTVAGNVRCDAGNPNLSGMDILELPVTGKFVATGADSTALTITVVSAEATP